MVDYYEKQSNAFPRRPNFARRNLMERQKSIPAGYKVPAPRPLQYGSPSTYSSSYSYGYIPSMKLHAQPPARAACSAPPAGNKPAPTRASSGRLRPSRPPAVTSLIDRLSRPTAASAARRARTAGWSEEGKAKALDDFAWNNLDVFTDAHKPFYTPEGSVRAPATSLSQEVD